MQEKCKDTCEVTLPSIACWKQATSTAIMPSREDLVSKDEDEHKSNERARHGWVEPSWR